MFLLYSRYGSRAGRARGFSLIELMVVVTIAAILLVIALPSYQAYLLRAERSHGQASVLRGLAAAEVHRQQFFIWPTTFTDDRTKVDKDNVYFVPRAFNNGNLVYTYDMSFDPSLGFSVRATRINSDEDTDCWVMSAFDDGSFSSIGSVGTAATTRTCWP